MVEYIIFKDGRRIPRKYEQYIDRYILAENDLRDDNYQNYVEQLELRCKLGRYYFRM